MPTPVAPTPVAPTPVAPTPVAPTPVSTPLPGPPCGQTGAMAAPIEHPMEELRILMQGSVTAMNQFIREREKQHAAAAALCAKVGTSMDEVAAAASLDWSFKGLEPTDCKTIGMLIATQALQTLRTLDLYGNNSIGDEGVNWMAIGLLRKPLPISRLDLSHTSLSIEAVGTLASAFKGGGLSTLRVLSLGGNAIGDKGAFALAAPGVLPIGLTALFLGGTGIGDAGIQALVARPGKGVLETLEALDLNCNRITEVGCAALASAVGERGMPALKSLCLQGNPASKPALEWVQDVPIPPPGGLLPGWKARVDGTTGGTYYFNVQSREVRWDMPFADAAAAAQYAVPASGTI